VHFLYIDHAIKIKSKSVVIIVRTVRSAMRPRAAPHGSIVLFRTEDAAG
jgi:hypothetical protein